MARRTIHARRASPYLLYLVIAFAVLMVAGWVGFGYMYSLKNKAEIAVFGPERVDAQNADLEKMWADLASKYKEEGTLEKALESRQKTTIDFQSDVRRLTQLIASEPLANDSGERLRAGVSDVISTAQAILADAQAAQYTAAGGGAPVNGPYLDGVIHSLMQRVDALVNQINQDNTKYDQLKTQVTGLQAQLLSNKAASEALATKTKGETDASAAKLTADRESAIKTQTQLTEDIKRLTDTMLTQRKAAQTEKDKLVADMTKLQNDFKAMSKVVADFRKVPTAMSINGRVVSMGLQGQVAYGDLGKKDGILLGLTFSIFSPTELGKVAPQPKAQCRVVKVMNESCELRVYEIKNDNPVIAGDLLYNPVYDRTRRLHFAMVGKMDIENNTLDETEQLKGMIQEFGGKIDATMTVQTDFLIVGEKPIMASAPAAGASPMEQANYLESRKKYLEYTQTLAQAESYSIPMMSLNRFLGLMGLAERK
jgi:hypothetical protein